MRIHFKFLAILLSTLIISAFDGYGQVSPSVDVGCAPLNVEFSHTLNNVKTYNWQFSDGQSASVAQPTILFENPGTINLNLTVEYTNGNTENFQFPSIVKVDNEPTPDFTVSLTAACKGEEIQFTNASIEGVRYQWNFGDGNVSNEANPIHTYENGGVYTVTLKAYNQNDCEATIVKDNLIQVYNDPNVSISASRFNVCLNSNPVEFRLNGSGISNIEWSFGDGSTSSEPNPTYLYSNAGEYQVNLSYQTENGCLRTIQLSEKVIVKDFSTPAVSVSREELCASESVTVEADQIDEASYEWTTSDGRSFSGNKANIIFNEAGAYTISLNLTSTEGCFYQQEVASIQVKGITPIQFNAGSYQGCTPYNFELSNVTEGIDRAAWLVNGQEIQGRELSYQFTEAGEYQIVSINYFSNGCVIRKALDQKVEVLGEPSSFDISASAGCVPFNATFKLLNESADQVVWNLGNGESVAGSTANVSYTESGIYFPTVSYINQFGCEVSDSLPNKITVFGEGIALDDPDTIQSCTNTEVYFNGIMGFDSWEWDFGDGNSSTEANPVHVYTNPGVYTVSLKTNNKNGCSSVIENYNIIQLPDLSAEVEYQVTAGDQCGIFEASFSADLSDGQRAIWLYNDNVVATGASANITFLSLEDVTISLRIEAAGGCTQSKAITVKNPWTDCENEDIPPLDNPKDPLTGLSLQNINACNIPFELELTSPADQALSTEWTFEDGATVNEENFIHTFRETGTYTINLSAQITADSSIYVENYYTVNIQKGVIDFDYQIDQTCNGIEVTFTPAESDMDYFAWKVNNQPIELTADNKYLFDKAGLYQVSLEASGSGLCVATQVKNIFLGNSEHVFEFSPVVCLGDNFTVNQSLVGFDSFQWVINGSDTVTSEQLSYEFKQVGEYEVVALGISKDQCVYSFPLNSPIQVYNPESDFSANKTYGCGNQTITFTAKAQEGVSYFWDFGNGQSSNEVSPQVNYMPGTYSVQLITSVANCSDTVRKENYIVIDELISDFSYSYEQACFPVTVSFSNKSINAASYLWDFGDGHTSTELNPTHTYSEMPNKAVVLKVRNENGCEQTKSQNIEGLLYADITADNQQLCLPGTVQFNVESEEAVSWYWDFGDGSYAEEKDPLHVYIEPGIYDVSLIVSNSEGCQDTTFKSAFIEVKELESNFTFEDTEGANCVPHEVQFQNTSIGAVRYLWDFGDGKTSTVKDPVHVYTTVGEFDVSLISWNDIGCIDTLVMSNALKTSGPETSFSINSKVVCMPDAAQFTDESGDAISWIWYFGDGASSTDQNPSHVYEQAGWYTVRLISENTQGCTASFTMDSIRVLPTPKANFNVEVNGDCSPVQVKLTNASENLLSPTYEWDLGDGRKISEREVQFSYAQPGEYTIKLTVWNENACPITYEYPNKILVRDTNAHNEADIDLLEADNYSLSFDLKPYQGNNVRHYRVYRNSGNGFRFIKEMNVGETEFEDESVQPDRNIYEYKFQSILYCEDSVAKSDLITYNNLRLENNSEGISRFLQWNKHKGNPINNYRVFIRAEIEEEWSEIAVVDPTMNSFNDAQMLCAGRYFYKVAAFNSNKPVSVSNEVEVNVSKTSLQQLSATIKNTTVIGENQVLTEWVVRPAATNLVQNFELFRSVDGGEFEYYADVQPSEQIYIDEGADTDEHEYAYKVRIKNKCDILSDLSNSGSSLLVEKQSTVNHYELRWNEYSGWEEGVLKYLLQRKNALGEWETVEEIPADQTQIKIVRPKN